MNPNKEYHDLNPDCSRAAWDCIIEYMLSNCNWVNQAQLKQPWSFYSLPLQMYTFSIVSQDNPHVSPYAWPHMWIFGMSWPTVYSDRQVRGWGYFCWRCCTICCVRWSSTTSSFHDWETYQKRVLLLLVHACMVNLASCCKQNENDFSFSNNNKYTLRPEMLPWVCMV